MHEGPPFPLFVDEPIGGYVVSLWADPDVGTGTFLAHWRGTPEAGEAPPEFELTMRRESGAEPVRAAFVHSTEKKQEPWTALIPLDREGTWSYQLSVRGTRGSGVRSGTVEATPDGPTRGDLILYGAPFLLVGLVWCAAVIKSMRRARTHDDGRRQ